MHSLFRISNPLRLEKIQKSGASLAAARRGLFSQRITEIIVNKFNRFYAFGSSGRRNQDETTTNG
ncbi:MAG: hypothetical protein WAL66_07185, partial [Nitrososphaeraceae archaeon]